MIRIRFGDVQDGHVSAFWLVHCSFLGSVRCVSSVVLTLGCRFDGSDGALIGTTPFNRLFVQVNRLLALLILSGLWLRCEWWRPPASEWSRIESKAAGGESASFSGAATSPTLHNRVTLTYISRWSTADWNGVWKTNPPKDRSKKKRKLVFDLHQAKSWFIVGGVRWPRAVTYSQSKFQWFRF